MSEVLTPEADAPAAPHTHAAPPLSTLSPRITDRLDGVRRALRYAVREDGAHLWAVPWLGRSSTALLSPLLSWQDAGGVELLVRQTCEALKGLDELPWTSRVGPTLAALDLLDSALAEAPQATPLSPRVQLLEIPAVEERPAQQPSPAPQAAAPARAPEPSPAPAEDDEDEYEEEEEEQVEDTRAPLGAPSHTGQPLGALSSIRPDLEAALIAAGVVTIADLLRLIPADQQRLTLLSAGEPVPEDSADRAVSGELVARCLRLRPGGRAQELWVRSGDAVYRCRWMGPLPSDLNGPVGTTVTIAGRVEWTEEGPILYEGMRWEADPRGFVRRPVYGLPGVPDEDLWPLLRIALTRYSDRLIDPLPLRLLQDARIPALDEALRELHLPTMSLRRARARWVFEDFFYHQLGSAGQAPVRLRGIPHTVGHEAVGKLQLIHNLELGDAQEIAFDEIRRDLRRPVAMNRLLQGDVGSGKALVALLTAVVVGAGRSQVLVLAPDLIAAEHRLQFAEPMLRSVGLSGQVVTPDGGAAQLEALRRGEIQVAFSTHELARTALPEFKKLGLVVVEERSSFGVIQRDILAQKGVHPDLLVVTSVPLPTILTFTLFADFDISVIRDEAPLAVESVVRAPEQRSEAYARICEQLAQGQQAYVVLPMVKGQDAVDLPTARQLATALSVEAFPGYRVGVYHGAMPQAERLRVYEDLQHRRLDVLLATTAVEDAPEVANATCMLIENAERYDLVRLHRLRGHVGRGPRPGLCFFVLGATLGTEASRLVELVAQETDGFAIAEQDRLARGDLALLGERAAEMPSFRVGDPSRDRDVLLKARRAAISLLQQDPQLRQRAHRDLAALVLGREEEPAPAQASGPGRNKRRRRRKGRR